MIAEAPVRYLITIDEFEAFTYLPENEDKIWEFIGGEVYDVPSNAYASKIGVNVLLPTGNFVKQHKLGLVTGENGGYQVMGERYAPDVAFISYTKQPELALDGYNPNPPDLAVEVEFPTSTKSDRRLRIKVANYLAAGTTVWVIYLETHEVEVFAPGQSVKILGINDTLDGGNVLPGFTLAVKNIFEN